MSEKKRKNQTQDEMSINIIGQTGIWTGFACITVWRSHQ